MIDNNLFHRYCALNIPKDTLGLDWSNNNDVYFCTPVDAEVIGWLGVDGIHFCFIPSISLNLVFAVSPIPCGEHFVEPIARSFQDFLSLVYFCKEASPLEQICWMKEEQFLTLLKSEEENEFTEKNEALNTLLREFELEYLPNVYQYVKRLQADFDYSTIPFSKEYYDTLGIER